MIPSEHIHIPAGEGAFVDDDRPVLAGGVERLCDRLDVASARVTLEGTQPVDREGVESDRGDRTTHACASPAAGSFARLVRWGYARGEIAQCRRNREAYDHQVSIPLPRNYFRRVGRAWVRRTRMVRRWGESLIESAGLAFTVLRLS